MLAGPEVKSIREGRANLQDAYARVEDDEVWLYGMHVSPYSYSRDGARSGAQAQAAAPPQGDRRARARGTAEKGHTLVPLRVYFKDGRAKVELALARGKHAYDKRQAMAERDAKREAERAMKGVRE